MRDENKNSSGDDFIAAIFISAFIGGTFSVIAGSLIGVVWCGVVMLSLAWIWK